MGGCPCLIFSPPTVGGAPCLTGSGIDLSEVPNVFDIMSVT